MKKEQIDNFFAKVRQILELSNENTDEQILIEMFKLSSENIRDELGSKNIYELKIQDYENLFEDIIGQIQKNELYEYFLKVGTEKENLKIFEIMLQGNIQLPVEVVEKVIKDKDLVTEVEDIGNLIEKTKDVEFIKKCVKDKNLNITEIERARLVSLTNNKEFIKECIEDENVKIRKNSQTVELIKSTEDREFIKKCIQDEKLGLEGWKKVELIKSINDIEFTKKCIQDKKLRLESWNKVELIQSTNDIEYIKKCIQSKELELESWDKVNLIKTTGDVEYIKKCVLDESLEITRDKRIELIQSTKDIEYIRRCIQDEQLGLVGFEKARLIKSTNDIEFIKKCIRDEGLELKGWDKTELIKSTNDIEFIKECIRDKELGLEGWDKTELIKTTNDTEFIKSCIKDNELGLEGSNKVELIKSIHDTEFIDKCIRDEKLNLETEHKVDLIKFTQDSEYIKKCINDETLEFDEYQKASILLGLNDNDKFEIIKGIENQREEIARNVRRLGGFDNQTLEEKIELILQWENVQNPEEKLKVLLRLKEKNQEILQKMDFKILDEKYLTTLGEEKINFISNFPDIQDKILQLEQNELNAYTKIIESYEKEDKNGWRYLTINILDNISSYSNIIGEIDSFTQNDIGTLMLVMQNKNSFGLENLEDLRNYKEIKQNRCDEWINKSGNITRKKEALLYKLFGQDINYTEKILRRYGQDAESIENQDLKSYILALKEIMKVPDNETIEKIYQEVPEIEFDDVNKILIEKSIANEYEKLYNNGLLKVEGLEAIEENVYDAGTEFNILMTSIGAYHHADINNYNEDWNRPSLSSPHICCSYIRNDMIGTAPVHNICYGFSEMKPYSLAESNCHDIGSNGIGFISTSHGSKFYSPDNQINNTERYNEMDYARFQNGQKKQPDYIIVFKENGQVQNLEEAKKASKDWGGMPIVVVDKDKCLETERSRLDNLLDKYRAGDKTLAREIYYKIRNNRVTRKAFAEEINIDEFKREMEEQEKYNQEQIKSNGNIEVTKEDMQKNSEQVTAEERNQEMSRMKQLYLQIHSIAKDDKDVELE